MKQYNYAKKHNNGFIQINLNSSHEVIAKKIRKDRDSVYQNIFTESSTDKRYVGDLGEFVFNSWLKHQLSDPDCFKWLVDEPAGKCDFTIFEHNFIGIKTVKRKGPPKPNYTAQISAKHVNEPSSEFFFLSYDYQCKSMWLLGGVSKVDFLKFANFYNGGEKVHEGYTVRQGHSIYNIEINHLLPPDEWLKKIQATGRSSKKQAMY